MNSDDAHDLECARAALCGLIERAKAAKERKYFRDWLREIERKYLEPSPSGV